MEFIIHLALPVLWGLNMVFKLPLIMLILFCLQCGSRGPLVKEPAYGQPTEFHHAPEKTITQLYISSNQRGVTKRGKLDFSDTVGFGIGGYFYEPLNAVWFGHKFMYFYIDLEVAPENQIKLDGTQSKSYLLGTSPGIFWRSYLPLFLKTHYGGGVDLRVTDTKFDRWGMYGLFGLEFYGFTFSTKILAHPGQPNIEQEYRYGFMAYPVDF